MTPEPIDATDPTTWNDRIRREVGQEIDRRRQASGHVNRHKAVYD